jgi:hypothetical protein
LHQLHFKWSVLTCDLVATILDYVSDTSIIIQSSVESTKESEGHPSVSTDSASLDSTNLRLKIFMGKKCICTKYVQTFFLSLFIKTYSITIFIAFTLY